MDKKEENYGKEYSVKVGKKIHEIMEQRQLKQKDVEALCKKVSAMWHLLEKCLYSRLATYFGCIVKLFVQKKSRNSVLVVFVQNLHTTWAR